MAPFDARCCAAGPLVSALPEPLLVSALPVQTTQSMATPTGVCGLGAVRIDTWSCGCGHGVPEGHAFTVSVAAQRPLTPIGKLLQAFQRPGVCVRAPAPTRAPTTVHMCETSNHGCDKFEGGICVKKDGSRCHRPPSQHTLCEPTYPHLPRTARYRSPPPRALRAFTLPHNQASSL